MIGVSNHATAFFLMLGTFLMSATKPACADGAAGDGFDAGWYLIAKNWMFRYHFCYKNTI